MYNFGNHLKALRAENGLTQAQLGKVISYTQPGIAKLESGEREPSIENLIKLSRFFHITVDELLDVEEDYF